MLAIESPRSAAPPRRSHREQGDSGVHAVLLDHLEYIVGILQQQAGDIGNCGEVGGVAVTQRATGKNSQQFMQRRQALGHTGVQIRQRCMAVDK